MCGQYMRLTADEEEGEDLMQDLDEDLDMGPFSHGGI